MTATFSLRLNMRNLAIVTLAFMSPLVLASTLKKIDVSQLPGDKFEVRLAFDEAPPEPKGYTIEKPARIVLDFPDVDSSIKERRIPLTVPNGQSAMVLTSEGRTRLIVNLDQLASYTSRQEGNSYILEVGSVGATDAVQSGSKVNISNQAPAAASSGQSQVTSVDFRRGANGEGRIVLGLSNTKVSANLVGTGAGVKLTFKGMFLPPELRRRLDVLDFATPVSVVNSSQDGENVVFNVSASGEFDYLAYQTDREYVVSIKPLTEREKAEKKEEFAYVGNKLSLDFQDIEVRAVLQIIADFTNLNLVASDTVSGRITLRLQNVPWDQALDLVLKTKGLDKRLVGNVMMVAPAAEIAERERREIETKKQLEELAPLRTEYIRVRYANATEMFNLFSGGGKGRAGGGSSGAGNSSMTTESMLSDRGSGTVDERTNSIIITDTAERIEAFKRLVEQIDIPIRQVMIEARIVVANNNFQRELGIRWGGATFNADSNRIIDVAGSQDGLDDDGGTSPFNWFNQGPNDNRVLNLTENNMVDLATTGTPAGSAAIGILTDNAYLDLELTALENSGYAEIVSQPKVITSDKQAASIRSGKEIAYQEASASGATSTSFKEAVLLLEVTPQITPDNRIIMDLSVSKDALSAVVNGVPTIDVTRLQTKVLVNNGQTVVLGGVFSLDAARTESKVPVLGDIPYLGRLFKRTLTRTDKSELLIFITPRLLAESLDK